MTNRLSTPKRQELLLNIDPFLNQSAIIWQNWKLIYEHQLVGNNWYVPPVNITNQTSSQLLKYTDRLNSSSYRVLRQLNRQPNYSVLKQSTIRCGRKPSDALTNCRPGDLCLYNILDDPCEYSNRAQDSPNVVNFLWNRLKSYNRTTVPPLTVGPTDDNSNPKYFKNVWSCWQDI
ncbi:uncharacterized protein LOC128963420 [Oppia nitens]|uniref:uncharacterized protein LOC128963420 n=1 Tax=Oppia nitens TaxID=1686743 RepID=UPI0023DCB329|nr:uncharacterized protein LOC128963420 [Oppia nitens]